MAPEVLQRLGGLAPADVYALAVTLNEAATGARPFSDCTRDNPACQTVLNYNYGRCGQCLTGYMAPKLFSVTSFLVGLYAGVLAPGQSWRQ